MLLAGVGTYALRASMVAAQDRFGIPAWLERHSSLISASVLGAMVASSLSPSDGARLVPGVVEAGAVAVAFVAVRRTGNLAWALAVGLPVFWLGQATGLP
jgi:branched-subunit amino acid transport protein